MRRAADDRGFAHVTAQRSEHAADRGAGDVTVVGPSIDAELNRMTIECQLDVT